MCKKVNLLLVILIAYTQALVAGTQVPNELAKVRGVGIQTQIYSALNDERLPSSWDDFIEYDPEFKSLVELEVEGNKITELYSFISEEDRAKFPEGELLLIRHKPTDWPEVWNHTHPHVDPSELTEEQREKLKDLADRQQPIRYLVYRNERGDLDSVWWFEKDVQKMLAETGIQVPEPVPYQVSIDQASPTPTVEEGAESIEESTQPKPLIEHPAEVAIAEPIEEAIEPSSNWLLWLIGAVVAVGGILFLRAKK